MYSQKTCGVLHFCSTRVFRPVRVATCLQPRHPQCCHGSDTSHCTGHFRPCQNDTHKAFVNLHLKVMSGDTGFAIITWNNPKKLDKPEKSQRDNTWQSLGLILSMVTVGTYGGPRDTLGLFILKSVETRTLSEPWGMILIDVFNIWRIVFPRFRQHDAKSFQKGRRTLPCQHPMFCLSSSKTSQKALQSATRQKYAVKRREEICGNADSPNVLEKMPEVS